MCHFMRITPSRLCRPLAILLAVGALCLAFCHAQAKSAPEPTVDVLVLSNGDTLHGKLVNEVSGKVTFHTDSLGDLSLSWDKIKELHAAGPFAILDKTALHRGKRRASHIPAGPIEVSSAAVTVQAANAGPAIPVSNAQYIVDETTLEKQINHKPGILTGWNGAATAGATLVNATQNQYTVSGGLGLSRTVPTVSWLNPRNRTSADFNGSYGKITQPGYTSAGVFVQPQVTKSAIFHLDGERDEYISPRFFALAQVAFDHNFAQDLQLQQIYGGGMGWTVLTTPKQQVDLKATVQYEKQAFITGSTGSSQNLVGSTFAANYILKLKLFTWAQSLQFIPAYNVPRAYSANEADTVSFPAYKNLAFSLGTIDSYFNNPPLSEPPTRRNSFQFIMGLTYALKSKY